MIIYEDKGYEINSAYPNEDWTGEALYVVENYSELAMKIQNAYPYYDFVVEDGQLIDIVELPRPEPEDPQPSDDPNERITNLENALDALLEELI